MDYMKANKDNNSETDKNKRDSEKNNTRIYIKKQQHIIPKPSISDDDREYISKIFKNLED